MKTNQVKYLRTIVLLVLLGVPLLQGIDSDVPEFSKRINEFTADLLKYHVQSADAQKNIVISAQSIFHGLAMSYIASSGTTRQELAEYVLGVHNPILVQIPPGVYHGFKGVSLEEAIVVNCPTEPYNRADPDEYRVDPHDNDIPYDWALKDG